MSCGHFAELGALSCLPAPGDPFVLRLLRARSRSPPQPPARGPLQAPAIHRSLGEPSTTTTTSAGGSHGKRFLVGGRDSSSKGESSTEDTC